MYRVTQKYCLDWTYVEMSHVPYPPHFNKIGNATPKYLISLFLEAENKFVFLKNVAIVYV